MKHLLIASLLTLIILSPLQAAPLTTEDKDNLLKVRHMQHILYESYLVTDKGLASVFGYHFDTSPSSTSKQD